MRATFFKNYSDNNVVSKHLEHLAYGADNIVEVKIIKDCSFTRPILLLGSANFDFSNCNYLFLDIFNRYYYIEDIEITNNGMIYLHCRVDVLMSFGAFIRNLYTTVERQESTDKCNPYIEDTNVVARIDRQYVKKQIGSVGGNATGTHICLTVTGGN